MLIIDISNASNYVVFDLEATCWEKKAGKTSEIIEIGAVKLNKNLEPQEEFSKFLRPVINPVLSKFCIELTSIAQSMVDNAQVFEEAIKEFADWAGTGAVFCSWGDYDKKQILLEAKIKEVSISFLDRLEKNHVNLKHEFAKEKKRRPCGMKKALNILGISHTGTHHRGIDDARNIVKIMQYVFGNSF